ncbi:uncharacterized protein PV09_09551 [Verruconis gallopava]|uniref:Zn(2)-C6 fungal-type domain-containing protein n=1 Tax=Verruconis gallopava TaxID=253628 RepID=A0A0D1X973_9PEZI|nr:uncharacterized protein PV09_09551 [Verruconis gallopava]KIV98670.1 hypothetical protein PV09_09551 [Verruconis gallopava]
MVGVPGKSRACWDCKKRRVKCGLERPECRRCSKAGRKCLGYDQSPLFVNRTIDRPHLSAPEVIAEGSMSKHSWSSTSSELERLYTLYSDWRRNPVTFRLLAYRLIEKLYLPCAETVDGLLRITTPFSWISAACELSAPNDVLDRSLLAFCTTQVYATETGHIDYETAVETYNSALRMLSDTLAREAVNNPIYILASIVILSICELFIFYTDEGWRAHVQGVADVLRLRQSEAVSPVPSSIWYRLCSRLRVMSVLSQLIRRQKGALTAAQWMEVLPEHADTDPLDKIMHICCDLPDTLEAIEDVLIRDNSFEPCIQKITDKLVHTLAKISLLQSNLLQSSPTALYTTVPALLTSPADNGEHSKLFPFVFTFRSLQVASYFIVSWALQLHIYMSLMRLSMRRGSSGDSYSTVLDLLAVSPGSEDEEFIRGNYVALQRGTIKEVAEKLAHDLCRSVEYCHKPHMGTYGPQTMLYSQWVLREYFQHFGSQRELLWILAVKEMRGAPTRCGMMMMKFQT